MSVLSNRRVQWQRSRGQGQDDDFLVLMKACMRPSSNYEHNKIQDLVHAKTDQLNERLAKRSRAEQLARAMRMWLERSEQEVGQQEWDHHVPQFLSGLLSAAGVPRHLVWWRTRNWLVRVGTPMSQVVRWEAEKKESVTYVTK
ncbi:hypothetical protein B0H13DRAFT_2289136 [Mycena leptocephala]|nr:hypothetical protein B0H13DRAFT_2289136 [Mycena leptocephala]